MDDHPEPIKELIRIYGLQQLYFAKSKPENVVAIEGEVQDEVVKHLMRLDYLKAEPADGEELYKALTAYIHTENFEEREQETGKIDLDVLEFMRMQ